MDKDRTSEAIRIDMKSSVFGPVHVVIFGEDISAHICGALYLAVKAFAEPVIIPAAQLLQLTINS